MKHLMPIVALLGLLISLPASAAGKFYTQEEFDVLNATGKTIVIHVHADWCGTCKAQDIQVNAAMNSSEFNDVVFLR